MQTAPLILSIQVLLVVRFHIVPCGLLSERLRGGHESRRRRDERTVALLPGAQQDALRRLSHSGTRREPGRERARSLRQRGESCGGTHAVFATEKESRTTTVPSVLVLLQVFSWTGEMPPDPRRPLDASYDDRSDRLNTYNLEVRLQ